jgi:hypothetical protein
MSPTALFYLRVDNPRIDNIGLVGRSRRDIQKGFRGLSGGVQKSPPSCAEGPSKCLLHGVFLR